jgi:hypothetical protein
MYKLFIDDERLPHRVTWVELPNGPWVSVKNYDQFVSYIKDNGIPEFVSFDHDLADGHYPSGVSKTKPEYHKYKEKTGYDCAKWLVEYCMDNNKQFPAYEVHSMNPIGKINIRSLIENFKNTIK